MAHANSRRPRTGPFRRAAVALGAAALTAPLFAGCGSSGGGNTINLYSYPQENMQTIVDNCNKKANNRYHIVYNKLPRDADGQREQMVRRLAAGDTGLDILGLDVTWTAEFAQAGWIEEWKGDYARQATEGVLPGPLKTAKYNGKVYAATNNTNAQLLWYRDDVTKNPPRTWDQLIDTAKQLKAQGKPYRILFTGAQYEGLVVFYNSLVESAGGHILSEDGKRVVMDQGAVEALRLLKKLVTSGVTDPSLTNQQEDQVRLAFEQGDTAAFELNWPFIYPAMQEGNPELAKHLKWTRYPSFGDRPSRVTIGGINFGISSYSQKKDAAFQAALCLRSKENQKFAALKDGVPPTIESIYTDNTPLDPKQPPRKPGTNGEDDEGNPSMQTEYPMRASIEQALKEAAVRPLTPAYQSLSTVMSKVLSPPSAIEPEQTAAELRERLTAALNSQGVIP